MMAQAQVIHGTIEEITARLHQAYTGQRLRVFVEPEELESDLSEDFIDAPNRVRDAPHLEQLLLASLDSPTHEVTDETFEQIRQEVRSRHAARRKS